LTVAPFAEENHHAISKGEGGIEMARHARIAAKFAWPRKLVLFFVASALLAVGWPALAQTTYTYSSAPNYSLFTNFTPPCTLGSCTDYTNAMTFSGSFTTATPLAANLVNVDIAAQITTFSFSDGINTYAPPNGRIITFNVYTDASGVPTNSTFLDIQEWTTGSAPHTTSDRFSDVDIDVSATVTNNISCSSVGTSGGTADACVSSSTDSNSSSAENSASGIWSIAGGQPPPKPTVITPVPTLSTWALGALATLVVTLGWLQARRNRRA
jgi:IPTL-CTERM motif